MSSRLGIVVLIWFAASLAADATAKPLAALDELSAGDIVVLPPRSTHDVEQRVGKAAVDTLWLGQWTFDGVNGACDDTGWETVDNRMLNDGEVYWSSDDSRFDGMGGITGEAAVCGSHSLCWVYPDGYGNDWYQALRIEYSGQSYLSFDYLLDSETGWDFIRVEVDSACSSFDQVDFDVDQSRVAHDYRGRPLFEDSGEDFSGRIESLALGDFGVPATTHCAYIVFFSDGAISPQDGLESTAIGAAIVVDNLELTGGTAFLEDFEATGTLHPALSFVNMHDSKPYGVWARLYKHVTENDVCTENTTCAWLYTDDTTPTLFTSPEMSYGPGGYVVRSWIDNSIVSPWVNLRGTETPKIVISRRTFGGNPFLTSRLGGNLSYRVKVRKDDVDTPSPGDSLDCVSAWYGTQWGVLDLFRWGYGTTARIPPATSDEIQFRWRVTDWQWLVGMPPPPVYNPGFGPFLDDVRIGQVLLNGPVFSSEGSWWAEDAFPTEVHPSTDPSTGERYRPTTGRFGTAAFSRGAGDLIAGGDWIAGDEIAIVVQDSRGAGGITRVEWYGAIVSGPHAGKAPPPWTVGVSGFFMVPADSARESNGAVIEDAWHVDLDDDYFRGGDVLKYFWLAEDAKGGVTSDPEGLTAVPSSPDEAERLTGGLAEVSFLPTIDWDPGYLARIAADPHGKLEPTQDELANSRQAHCILYHEFGSYQGGFRRKSGNMNRTPFMHALDQLGYRGHYDVYDRQGYGNRGNYLHRRARVEQMTGYALLIQDSGTWNLPHALQIDQAEWYRDWLGSAAVSEAGTATLWLIGQRLVESTQDAAALLFADMGTQLGTMDVLPATGSNPGIEGQTSFDFANGNNTDFTGDDLVYRAGCFTLFWPVNAIDASGTSVVTHSWKSSMSGAPSGGAIVMNANPPASWNTIMQAPAWEAFASGPGTSQPEQELMTKILNGVLPTDCIQSPDPNTDVRDEHDGLDHLPKVTALHHNVPNPFNPTTTIHFDLASDTHVQLRIYNVSGRLVRTLVNGLKERKRHAVLWDGMDNAGNPVSSGVYFYRLKAGDFADTRKMVVLR